MCGSIRLLLSVCLYLCLLHRSGGNQYPSSHGQWTTHVHSDGRTYYYNRLTGVSSWSPPPGNDANLPLLRSAPVVPVSQTPVGSSTINSSSQGRNINAAYQISLKDSKGAVKVEESSRVSAVSSSQFSVEYDPTVQKRRITELEGEVASLRRSCERLQGEIDAKIKEEDRAEEEYAAIEELKSALITARDDARAANDTNYELVKELFAMKQMAQAAADFIVAARRNATSLGEDLAMVQLRLSESEKELSDAFEEIGSLEDELRRVSEESVRKMRSSPLKSLVMSIGLPFWPRKKQEERPVERYASRKAEAKSAVSRREISHNVTLALIRENMTAMSLGGLLSILPSYTG
jgi:WW domain